MISFCTNGRQPSNMLNEKAGKNLLGKSGIKHETNKQNKNKKEKKRKMKILNRKKFYFP